MMTRMHATRVWLAAASLILGACTTLPPRAPESSSTPAPAAPVVQAPITPASPTGTAAPRAGAPATPPSAAPSPSATETGAAASAVVTSPVVIAPVVTATVQPPTPAADEPAAAVQPVDPLQPEWRPSSERVERLDLWQRIRDGHGVPDLDTPIVRSREQAYASNPDYLQRMFDRGGRYLFHIVEEVQRRKMPTELALLPFVESAFNPTALSSARASGIWQFMPQTGRHYELTQNVFRDDRRDVLASTQAALDYLARLHGMFGDWQLALAAYNWGEGNVRQAIKRNQAAGLPTDYLALRMPHETRHYVPKLQAIKNIVTRPEAFGVRLPPLENHPYFLAVQIRRDIDVDLAAKFAQLPLDEFKALNPQAEKPVILAAGTPQVLLPYDNANAFVKALGKHKGPMASWTAWTVPSTMKAAEAAQRVGMSDEGFRTINHIPPRMLLKSGSTVLAPRGAKQGDVSEHVADHASMALSPEAPPERKLVWRVGKRAESVAAVAKRYNVDATKVARWNGVPAGATFAPGTRVTLYVPVRAKATASERTKSAARTTAKGSVKAPGKGTRKAASTTRVAQSKTQPKR
jgi:membrane-bound lytic murein transglycosylase D